MVTTAPMINVQYRNIRKRVSVMGIWNSHENTKKLPMLMNRIKAMTDKI
jgi:hypothetical protein